MKTCQIWKATKKRNLSKKKKSISHCLPVLVRNFALTPSTNAKLARNTKYKKNISNLANLICIRNETLLGHKVIPIDVFFSQ